MRIRIVRRVRSRDRRTERLFGLARSLTKKLGQIAGRAAAGAASIRLPGREAVLARVGDLRARRWLPEGLDARRAARLFVVGVLAVDVVTAVVLLPSLLPAEEGVEAVGDGGNASPEPQRHALELLARQLSERAANLERREAELEELMRSEEVLRRASLLEKESRPSRPASDTPAGPETDNAFSRLQRAYENMEPDSAARALAELAERDKDAVIGLLLGWRPRTSGAVLDSLAQTDAALAADLSYEIWKRAGGNVAASAARSGR